MKKLLIPLLITASFGVNAATEATKVWQSGVSANSIFAAAEFASVSFSPDRGHRASFLAPNAEHVTCEEWPFNDAVVNKIGEKVIDGYISINGRPARALVFCKRENNHTLLQAILRNKASHNIVKDEFSKANKVTIDIAGVKSSYSALGFTKAYNDFLKMVKESR